MAAGITSTLAGLTLIRREIQIRADAYSLSSAQPRAEEASANLSPFVGATHSGVSSVMEDQHFVDADSSDRLEKRHASGRKRSPVPV